MKFFSGFSLQNDREFSSEIIKTIHSIALNQYITVYDIIKKGENFMENSSKTDFPTWGEGGIMHPIPRTVLIEIPLIFP